ALPPRRRLLRSNTTESDGLSRYNSNQRSSYECFQTCSHFLGGPEQTILRGFLSGSDDVADRAQAQSLIVAQFEYGSLARSEPAQRPRNPVAQLAVPHLPLGIGMRAAFFQLRHAVHHSLRGLDHGRL